MENLGWVSRGLIALTVILVVLSMIPILVNHYRIAEFVETGPISDTVGNLANPFINIASIAMMFLAFYMQYRANKLVIKQFEHNQFEHRFFELLKINREYSAELVDSFYDENDSGTTLNKRRGFEYLVKKINNEYNSEVMQEPVHDNKKVFSHLWESYQDEYFDQYFRHMYTFVRFVVSKDFLTYEQKRSYLRIVRSSLSAYEQILLYYNWLSGDGEKWEDGENRYFTDYRMLHNIKPTMIISDFDIRQTPPFKELIKNGNYKKEKWRADDPLFDFMHRQIAM